MALMQLVLDFFKPPAGAALPPSGNHTSKVPPAQMGSWLTAPETGADAAGSDAGAALQPPAGAGAGAEAEAGAGSGTGAGADGAAGAWPSAPLAPVPPPGGGARSQRPRPAPPALPPPPALPGTFRHPRASRTLLLRVPPARGAPHTAGAEVLVAYALARARRRTIGFVVNAEGLAVRAPAAATLLAIDAALQSKAGWIVRKLAQAQAQQARAAQVRIDWQDGALLPYLGAWLRVRLDVHASAAGTLQVLAQGCAAPGETLAPTAPRYELRIALAAGADAAALRAAVQAWLQRQARAHFAARLDHFAPLLGVQWRTLALSSARTRWGTAKSDGSIRLNWRLLHHRPAVIDYVVAHELAHLRVMDHSARFWRTVASVVPDHAQLRRRLYDEPVPRWD